VTLLVGAGHDVTGVARTPQKAAILAGAGAVPASIDVFDQAAVTDAVAGHDVVCNLATHIPPSARAALPGAWDDNDRLRRDASRNLVDGAVAGGATRFVQESVTFAYSDARDVWIDETASYEPAKYAGTLSDAEASTARFTAGGGAGVVLRFAAFYGPDSHHTVDELRAARRRVALQPGRPGAWWSSIHSDDAAGAVVAALHVPAGVYNVADDEPLTRADRDQVLAAAVGVGRLRRPPAAITRLGGAKIGMLMRSQRVSAARFREASGWTPAYPSVRDGMASVVAAVGGAPD
jgi:nucleoside-diphosphate-sugar epimerase